MKSKDVILLRLQTTAIFVVLAALVGCSGSKQAVVLQPATQPAQQQASTTEQPAASKPAGGEATGAQVDPRQVKREIEAKQAADEAFRRAWEDAARQQPQQEQTPQMVEAGRPHVWAPISVPGYNIQAVLNTSWSNGQLSYRVALLGERVAINNFLNGYQSYSINLANQWGEKTAEFPFNPGALKWEPDSYNQGMPTRDMTAVSPCTLEDYENAVQWNLVWH